MLYLRMFIILLGGLMVAIGYISQSRGISTWENRTLKLFGVIILIASIVSWEVSG